MNKHDSPPTLSKGQAMHFGALALLLGLAWLGWEGLGGPASWLFWTAVALPVIHQVFVWAAWRMELNSGAVSGSIGFHGYLFAFFLLFFGRFVLLFALAWQDSGSLAMPPVLRFATVALLTLPGGYAAYSVARYFGFVRAAGADHFDSRYRSMPLVKQGIFRFTNNGMYLYVFLLFWAIAVGFNSSAALLVTAFSHAYIWVHFYATEKPDMDYLYGPG